jgi:hypothetical protein
MGAAVHKHRQLTLRHVADAVRALRDASVTGASSKSKSRCVCVCVCMCVCACVCVCVCVCARVRMRSRESECTRASSLASADPAFDRTHRACHALPATSRSDSLTHAWDQPGSPSIHAIDVGWHEGSPVPLRLASDPDWLLMQQAVQGLTPTALRCAMQAAAGVGADAVLCVGSHGSAGTGQHTRARPAPSLPACRHLVPRFAGMCLTAGVLSCI